MSSDSARLKLAAKAIGEMPVAAAAIAPAIRMPSVVLDIRGACLGHDVAMPGLMVRA